MLKQIKIIALLKQRGRNCPPFEGEEFIRTNDYVFYLGDCVWEPLEDKLGEWKLTTFHVGKIVAQKTFRLVEGND